jgi:ADP-heptose:LPS heptosyltransferase
VVAPAGIGDTLCLTPAIRQLGQTDPNVSMTLYVAQDRGADQVMAGMSPVDRQVPVNLSRAGVGKVIPLIRDLRRNPPDLLASTLISRWAWVVGALAGVKDRRSWVPQWSLAMRWGSWCWRQPQPYNPRPRDVGRQDALAFCRLLGVAAPDTLQPSMAPPLWEEEPLLRARLQLGELSPPVLMVNAVAHPSLSQRQYPLTMLGQALAELLRRGAIGSVVLLGDSYSRSCHGPWRAQLGPRVLDLSGKLSLSATAAVMAAGDAVLTIDGGLLHVALTTSLPVAALYGPTEIFSTDPRGLPGHYAALSAFHRCRCECLPHRGIRARPECREGSQCLASLDPEEIVAAVAALLKGGGNAAGGGERQT